MSIKSQICKIKGHEWRQVSDPAFEREWDGDTYQCERCGEKKHTYRARKEPKPRPVDGFWR